MESEHRNIIITDDKEYFVLNVLDIISFKNEHCDFSKPLMTCKLPKVPTVHRETNILDALKLVESSEFLCVLDEEGDLYGLVTHSDIVANLDPSTLIRTYKLEDFFKIGKSIKTTSLDAKTSDVLQQMIDNNYDSIVVLDETKKPLGILTTKNVIALLKTQKDLSLPVKHYMITPVDAVKKSITVQEALEYIKQKHYKRVVVVDDDGSFVGIIKQSELISLTYSNWVNLMHKYQEELSEINAMLMQKSKKYEHLAATDPLTGLYNRSKFSELFLSEYNTMIRRDNAMSLIMLDIDFFKKVNDTYGHDVGDRVLVQVAHTLLKTLRNVDIIARWGGEEFVMLLPTADKKTAKEIANKIRVAIKGQKIDGIDGITASLGVSEVTRDDTLESALKRADEALYSAKKSGRDCVKVI